jgi:thioredoxin:protein disulfide reductase
MNRISFSMRLSRFLLLLLCFSSSGLFAEETKPFGFLSGLKQLGTSFDKSDEEELLPPDQACAVRAR